MSENLFESGISGLDITHDLNCALVSTRGNGVYLYNINNSEILNSYSHANFGGNKLGAELIASNDILIAGNNDGSISSYYLIDVSLQGTSYL